MTSVVQIQRKDISSWAQLSELYISLTELGWLSEPRVGTNQKGGVPRWNAARKLEDFPLCNWGEWCTRHLEHTHHSTTPSTWTYHRAGQTCQHCDGRNGNVLFCSQTTGIVLRGQQSGRISLCVHTHTKGHRLRNRSKPLWFDSISLDPSREMGSDPTMHHQ